jgi:hypothetical protein
MQRAVWVVSGFLLPHKDRHIPSIPIRVELLQSFVYWGSLTFTPLTFFTMFAHMPTCAVYTPLAAMALIHLAAPGNIKTGASRLPHSFLPPNSNSSHIHHSLAIFQHEVGPILQPSDR